MRADGKPEGLRGAMSWVHTWSGLLPGWLLYAVFFTGTLSFFLDEINTWMKPETHRSAAGPQMVENALRQMALIAPAAGRWNLVLPGERQTTVSASWPKPVPPGEPAPRGRAPVERAELDATTGERIEVRDTRGAQFLYRFHFELHGMPREWGRWIVGVATMLMFVAILSGVITHKKIFTEFFTFRPGTRPRSWLDAHNATGVLALPFHVMITLSGLLLLMGTLMPWGVKALYEGDTAAYASERRALANPGGVTGQSTPARDSAGRAAGTGRSDGDAQAQRTARNGEGRERAQRERVRVPLADIGPMLETARQHWPERGIGTITVNAPGTARATIEMREQGGRSLANRGASERLVFDGTTGALKAFHDGRRDSPFATRVANVLTAAHLGRLAAPALRWLLFLSGVVGTVMIALGLVLWLVKRTAERRKGARPHAGHRLAAVLNLSVIGGLSIATAGLFWLNRLLPPDLAGRSAWEIKGFFLIWLAALLHAAVQAGRRGWIVQMGLAALLFALLPLLNPMTGGAGLASSVARGQWPVAGFDFAVLALALAHAAVVGYLLRRPVRQGGAT
ncbi:PepSY domain-containing protein [Betaproteobacteria bacterium SCN1]|nr:PepSY domain-containing protein [Betaproteobacteria bacterium SCN1]MBN8760240.1 PepSY domain-containing protein [Thiobacillus sp.]ODU89983.1 MAG: hypothetical protein ABT21_04650 [Thiobacillus sp. SCN 65-179]OJW39695.1 MAG: hypothetical protein BGO61_12350 [Thiobacillus sp. 65-69]